MLVPTTRETTITLQDNQLVSWSSTFNVSFQHKYETKGQSYLTQWRKASHILTSSLAAFLSSSHPKRDWEAHLSYYASAYNRGRQLSHHNYYYYYYIRLTAFWPGQPGCAGSRKVNHSGFYWSKRRWGDSGISWIIHNSFTPCSRQITTPVPHHSVFTGRMPFLLPNQQRQCTAGKTITPQKNEVKYHKKRRFSRIHWVAPMCTVHIESQKMFAVAMSLSCSLWAISAFCWLATKTPLYNQ